MSQIANNKIVYIVHCVDTEGPLYESLAATFERIENVFGIKLKPSQENLEKLRRGEGVPEDIRSLVMDFTSAKRLSYKADWQQLDSMLGEILSAQWRNKYQDI